MKQILVIDDDEAMLRLLRTWLMSAGYDVVALSDFSAAKNYLAHNFPGMVITDVRLGAYNGLQLAIFVKEAHPEVATVVMTGFDDKVIRDEAAHAGANYFVKPIAEGEFLKLVATCLQE